MRLAVERCERGAEVSMWMRNSLWALAVVVALLPREAVSAPYGTRTWAQLVVAGVEEVTTDSRIEALPATAASWLTDGVRRAAAVAPFGSLQARAISAPGARAWAASLWSDTLTLRSDVAASGAAPIAFHLHLDGNLDPSTTADGLAQLTLRALVGFDVNNADDALAPNVILDAAQLHFSTACEIENCEAGATPVSATLEVQTTFEYDVPFRLSVLLEALGANGGVARAGASGSLARIELPAGAVLHAASGWDYADVVTQVPEPGTSLLCALGLAALRVLRVGSRSNENVGRRMRR
jgi:hypothetical protein